MGEVGRERFFTMAEVYDKMCQLLVPQYDFLQTEVLKITYGGLIDFKYMDWNADIDS